MSPTHPITTQKIFPNVTLGPEAELGDFVIIGHPPRGASPGELPTTIGRDATIRSHTVVYAGNQIGDHFSTGHFVMVRESNVIGNHVSIGTGTIVEHHVEVHDNVRIHSNTFIPEFTVIEEEAWIGPSVVMTNTFHSLCPKAKECMRGPTIKKGAKVSANVTLLPWITIGERALIGAGAVVCDDVAPGEVVVGLAGETIKTIAELRCRSGLMRNPYLPDE